MTKNRTMSMSEKQSDPNFMEILSGHVGFEMITQFQSMVDLFHGNSLVI
eukprot:CAMPEP_0170548276 /NCGR_PEP_ID=MMETSP0211-20121228/6611_1 /TAXON_ID=311385 /ORGANISM="Pseudokeronopsis sp., Strain OXSARD2" /LENGTH=48 /DNA_ID= /DNA_START= /DNA_END= /DNA_ORIENTATION=